MIRLSNGDFKKKNIWTETREAKKVQNWNKNNDIFDILISKDSGELMEEKRNAKRVV